MTPHFDQREDGHLAGEQRTDRAAAHWKRLGLIPGAPECVIKAAHRVQIEMHHPDRGGDANAAKQVNVAYDELRGQGAVAHEYVASHFSGEPWVVLGLSSAADEQLVGRAGKQLAAELRTHPRLVEKVEWAVSHFASAKAAPTAPRARITPMTQPVRRAGPPPRQAPTPRPATPGKPDGLPQKIDFGTLEWRSTVVRTVQLTWKQFAPYSVEVDARMPIVADVVASKVLPGRFSITFSIDWDALAESRSPTTRGYTLDVAVTIRWTATDSETVRARGTILFPAIVSVSPTTLNLGTVRESELARASLLIVSTGAASVTIDPPPWLQRVDGSGKALEAPLALKTNTPVRLEFRVHWPPILERAASSFLEGRPVRPTGRITIRWNDQSSEVPAEIVVEPKTRAQARR